MFNIASIIGYIPSFDGSVEKSLRAIIVRQDGYLTITLAFFFIVVCLPLWNYLLLRKGLFNFQHELHHTMYKSWMRSHRLFHNQSLQISLFWIIFLWYTTFKDSHNDLMLICKKMGRVSVAMMPPMLFLTMRPSPLPHTLYLSLLPIHKWISRIVVVESLLHSILYLAYFVRSDKLYKMKDMANLYGVFSMIAFLVIAVTSLSSYRRWNFRVFYYTHYILTWMSVIMLQLHARPGMAMYTWLNVGILTVQIGYRLYLTSSTTVSVVNISQMLDLVEFPSSALRQTPEMPASHVRINNYHDFFLQRWFYNIVPFQHPYTVASLPNEDTVKLIIRKGNFPLVSNTKYIVTGCFEPKIDMMKPHATLNPNSIYNKLFKSHQLKHISSTSHHPLDYEIDVSRVFIVVGGSAISFGLPLLRILNYNGINVRLIWVSRDLDDLKLLKEFKGCNNMEIYITGDYEEEELLDIDYYDNEEQPGPPSKDYGALNANTEDEIDFTAKFSAKKVMPTLKQVKKLIEAESKESTPLLGSSKKTYKGENKSIDSRSSAAGRLTNQVSRIQIPSNVKLFFGRPTLGSSDLEWCHQDNCIGPSATNTCAIGKTQVDMSKVWCISAGPPGLVESTRRWAYDGGLHFHDESFSV